MNVRSEELLRRFAEGKVTSRFVRDQTGWTIADILAGLGDLGLRPPIARLDGVNGPALRRGRDLLASVLEERSEL